MHFLFKYIRKNKQKLYSFMYWNSSIVYTILFVTYEVSAEEKRKGRYGFYRKLETPHWSIRSRFESYTVSVKTQIIVIFLKSCL